MNWFKSWWGGPEPTPAPEEKKPNLPAPNPKIIFEMINRPEGESVRVTVDWAEGEDLEAFAYMLLYLQQGKLIEPIGAALSTKVRESTIKENARIIQDVINGGLKTKHVSEPGKPIVCPTRATSLLLKPFQH